MRGRIDLDKKWKEALRKTKIIRARYGKLNTFKKTVLPYVVVSRSAVSKKTTVIREGKVGVSRATVHRPDGAPIFSGFDFYSTTRYKDDTIKTFLLVRGVKLPSLRYSNYPVDLKTTEKDVQTVIKEYQELFLRKEDIETGLIIGIPDVWQFSLLIYIAYLIAKSVDSDLKNLLDELGEDF